MDRWPVAGAAAADGVAPAWRRRVLAAQPNVSFSDPVQQPMADLVQESRLVVSVFSTVLLEAMAMGVLP